MKLILTFLYISIITTILFSLYEIGNGKKTTVTLAIEDLDSFQIYNNSKLNFSIQYPSNWEITERKFNPELENFSSTVEIKSPFEDPQDLVQEQLVISLNILHENTTFDEYIDNALNQFKNEYRDFQLISNNSTIIDNHNARKLSYSYLAGEDPLSINLIMNHNIISDGNKVYVLSFGTPPDKYYNYLNIIQTMINSFKIFK